MSGLTNEGFVKREFTDIIADLKMKMATVFGSGISVDDSSPDVQEAGIMAEKYSELWAAMLEIYNLLDPNNSEGVQLDKINEGIRGIPRNNNVKSKVMLQLTGTAGTLIDAGSIASQSTINKNYVLQYDVTLDGSGDGVGLFICDTEGSFDVSAGTFDTIITPIVGWAAVANSTDGAKGTSLETDQEYRLRGNRSVAMRSKGLIESFEAEIASIQGVNRQRVYQNRTTSTDANGMPEKSIAVFVYGGVDQDIFNAIGRKINFGPEILGDVTGYFLDSRGAQHPVAFYRPTEIAISIEINITESTGWMLGAVKRIKDACVAYAAGLAKYGNNPEGYDVGEKVRASDFYSAIQSVDGFFIDTIQVKKTIGGSYASSVVIGWDEIATVVFDDISVNH